MKSIELTEYDPLLGALSDRKVYVSIKHIIALRDIQYRCEVFTIAFKFEVLEHPREIYAKIAALDEDEYAGDGD